jgi:hypothetical protein
MEHGCARDGKQQTNALEVFEWPEIINRNEWVAADALGLSPSTTGWTCQPFEIMRVIARHVKNLPGRKTDGSDAAWLAQLG